MAPKQIIRNGAVVDDAVVHLGAADPLPPDGDVTLPLARWVVEGRAPRSGRTGLRLHGTDDVRSLAGKLDGVDLIALEFPKFGDGRNYSTARILRDQLGYRGELRAVGDVLNDQLFYMHRCGINAFELHASLSAQSALKHLADFSVVYQTAADGRPPVYAR
jgi:uncharacterized protein (DUF934 family)